jgi:hypothetical protein
MAFSARYAGRSVTMRPDRGSICLLDTSSVVRHLGFDMFPAIGYDIDAFCSQRHSSVQAQPHPSTS